MPRSWVNATRRSSWRWFLRAEAATTRASAGESKAHLRARCRCRRRLHCPRESQGPCLCTVTVECADSSRMLSSSSSHWARQSYGDSSAFSACTLVQLSMQVWSFSWRSAASACVAGCFAQALNHRQTQAASSHARSVHDLGWLTPIPSTCLSATGKSRPATRYLSLRCWLRNSTQISPELEDGAALLFAAFVAAAVP